jgi:GSH-dependent disulfide-bond oxidoreductase
MNYRLHDRRYLAGDEYTIADMISYPWTVNAEAQGQDINEFKHFKRWFEEVGSRPAVRRGMEAGNNLRVDPSTLTAEERAQMRAIMYNQRAIPAPA